MDLAPTERFSNRAAAYVRGRPGYPRELIALLERECGLTPEWRIADIGSGTGLLSRVFLEYGCEVYGVEPNAEMRAAGERELTGAGRFRSISGRAEATGLPAAAFDLVTAGQAFHWFETQSARAEFRRILKPPGWVALVWNERLFTPGFMSGYENLQRRFAPERPHPSGAEFDAFFGAGAWRASAIPHSTAVDWETLVQRVESYSRTPPPETQEHRIMMGELHNLFRQFAHPDRVTFEYEARVYCGHLG